MPGLIRGLARTAAIAGTATAVSNRVSRRQANRWSHQADEDAADQGPVDQGPVDQAPAAASSGVDYDTKLAQLRQLGELHEQGVLDDAEFEMQKSAVLRS
jgi:Short C-terminal domain